MRNMADVVLRVEREFRKALRKIRKLARVKDPHVLLSKME